MRASSVVIDPAYDGAGGSYAERLRGRRFWLPLIALVAATVIGAIALDRAGSSAPPPAPTQDALAGLNPQIRALLTRLEADHLFCGSLRKTPTSVSCLFGAATIRTSITSFADHKAVVRSLGRFERAARATFTRTGAITFAVSGPKWLITGLWSQTGHYNEVGTTDAQTAQTVNKRLNGCLELLPREAGSCAF